MNPIRKILIKIFLCVNCILSFVYTEYLGAKLFQRKNLLLLIVGIPVFFILYLFITPIYYIFLLIAIYISLCAINQVLDRVLKRLLGLKRIIIKPMNRFYANSYFEKVEIDFDKYKDAQYYDFHLTHQRIKGNKNKRQRELISLFYNEIKSDLARIDFLIDQGIIRKKSVFFANSHFKLSEKLFNTKYLSGKIFEGYFSEAMYKGFTTKKYKKLQKKIFGKNLDGHDEKDLTIWKIYVITYLGEER
ncbi:hypothetical protein [Bacillus paranthracis]|uniref:hypothetical protein n=1 Tax=Bacillus paranthracis TaxID=2026186 RepID=UPI003DA9E495